MNASADDEPRDLGQPLADVPVPRTGRRWNPERTRESLRSIIAIASFALFSCVVLTLLLAVAVWRRPWDEMEGVATAVLPTVTSVVSAAIGFYYGTRGRQ